MVRRVMGGCEYRPSRGQVRALHQRRCVERPAETPVEDPAHATDVADASTVIFRNSAFVGDIAKTTIVAVLEQRGQLPQRIIGSRSDASICFNDLRGLFRNSRVR